MFFQHVYEEGLAQGSYVIGCQTTGEAIVIDPKRDIDTYLNIAEKEGFKIIGVTETHIHADFLSGSRELAKATGATLYLSDEGGEGWEYEFPHHGVKDGDEIKIGNLVFKVMHTPGHTPESITLFLTDTKAADKPVMAFTGDFVFVGDVGRPDLAETAVGIKGAKEEGAEEMYESIKRLEDIPDYIQIWPAHGAGSACGKALGAVPSSTLGYERIQNWAFQFGDNKKEFIEELLSGQPEPPKYFAKMKKYNKEERPVLSQLPKPKEMEQTDFIKAKESGIKIIDVRDKFTIAEEGFFPGSIVIGNAPHFSNWAGWFIEYGEPFILIAEPEEIDILVRRLVRIGMDNIQGFVRPTSASKWGCEKATMQCINASDLVHRLDDKNLQIVDIRSTSEYNETHIVGAEHVFLGTMEENLEKISRDKEVVIYCRTGYRATLAYSLLQKNGFKNIINYVGGIKEWTTLNNPCEATYTDTVIS